MLWGWLLPVLAVLIWTILLLRGYLAWTRMPKAVPRPSSEHALPAVAVFVPARNEVRTIAPCVTALARQGALIDRLVVIDDRSSDGTRERLAELEEQYDNLHVLTGRGPQPGEYGKPAALRDAVEAVRPCCEWLLFIDADVVVTSGAVAGLLDLARQYSADLVSVLPRLDLGTPIERLVMPSFVAIIAARHPAERVMDPESPLAFANGQVILVRRSFYELVGGHGALVGEILEDVRLAERVKAEGGALCLADGREVARTRMYESWAEIVEGWSKNIFLLVGASIGSVLAWSLGSIATASIGLLALITGGWPAGVVAYAWTLAIQMLMRRRGGAPPGWAIFAPIAAVLVAYVIVRSAWLHLGGNPIRWKGRRYRRVSGEDLNGADQGRGDQGEQAGPKVELIVASSTPPVRGQEREDHRRIDRGDES
ncbi:MAG: glycosyltransferase [Deltaproteobacteria bacterium]|nr:glycosyltransferase [Deltaproteobacteria bacterium]